MELIILKNIKEPDNYLKIITVEKEKISTIFGSPVIVKNKDDSICYSLGICQDLKRRKESVDYITGFVFDFDNAHGTKINYHDLNINYCNFAHTTFTHTKGHPKFRVIIPFDFKLLDFKHFETAWTALLSEMTSEMLACDKSSCQYYRNNFFPSCTKENQNIFEFFGPQLEDNLFSKDDYEHFASTSIQYPPLVSKKTGLLVSSESRHDILLKKGYEICSTASSKSEALAEFNKFIESEIEEPELFLLNGKRFSETMRGFNQGWLKTTDLRKANSVSLDFLNEPKEEPITPDEGITRAFLDEKAPPLVRDIANFLSSKQLAPPAFILGCVQEICSMSKGRGVLFHPLKSHPPMRAVCYNLYIGESGVGKGATLRYLRLALDELFFEEEMRPFFFKFKRESVSRAVASVSGLRNKIQEAGILMLKFDEYGEKMLKNIKSGMGHSAEIDDYLLELYGADEIAPQARSKGSVLPPEPDVVSPLFCFSGTTTPSIFNKLNDATVFSKGSISRMNLYYHFGKDVQDRIFRPLEDIGADIKSSSSLLETNGGFTPFSRRTLLEGFRDSLEGRVGLTSVPSHYVDLSAEAYQLLIETSQANLEHLTKAKNEHVKILHSRYFQKVLAMCTAFSVFDVERNQFYLDAHTTAFVIEVQRVLHKISLKVLENVIISSYREEKGKMSLQNKQICAMMEVLEVRSHSKSELAKVLGFGSHNDRTFKKTLDTLIERDLIMTHKIGRSNMVLLK